MPESRYADHFWVPFTFPAHGQMRHLGEFILSEGGEYRDLLLASDDLKPRRSPGSKDDGLDGWAYMMRTANKRLALLYFENGCDKPVIENMVPNGTYRAEWFDPRTGQWSNVGNGVLGADSKGRITMPDFPGNVTRSNTDWALKLEQN